jgi:hypothetical protein
MSYNYSNSVKRSAMMESRQSLDKFGADVLSKPSPEPHKWRPKLYNICPWIQLNMERDEM